jgi:hypothetical protein
LTILAKLGNVTYSSKNLLNFLGIISDLLPDVFTSKDHNFLVPIFIK